MPAADDSAALPGAGRRGKACTGHMKNLPTGCEICTERRIPPGPNPASSRCPRSRYPSGPVQRAALMAGGMAGGQRVDCMRKTRER